MAGTYTPNLNLYQPALLEDDWDALVDTNFTTLDSFAGPLDYVVYYDAGAVRLRNRVANTITTYTTDWSAALLAVVNAMDMG